MLGAIIGDIVGSRFEHYNYRSKNFDFYSLLCRFTDDSVMSLAICQALMSSKPDYSDLEEQAIRWMREIGLRYPNCGYGYQFSRWLHAENPSPYNSYGNGSAMRVSGCGYAASSLQEALDLAQKVTRVTHNHPEGLKGAEAVAAAIFMAREGRSIPEIRHHIHQNYYSMDFNIDDIRATYRFSSSCQRSVPQALECFFESRNFEDAVRIAVSLGGDSDTIGAIAGSIAEAFYGIPSDLQEQALPYLDDQLRAILTRFEERFPRTLQTAPTGVTNPNP